jgi:hypothetical protein
MILARKQKLKIMNLTGLTLTNLAKISNTNHKILKNGKKMKITKIKNIKRK